jgi:hypothetical protein
VPVDFIRFVDFQLLLAGATGSIVSVVAYIETERSEVSPNALGESNGLAGKILGESLGLAENSGEVAIVEVAVTVHGDIAGSCEELLRLLGSGEESFGLAREVGQEPLWLVYETSVFTTSSVADEEIAWLLQDAVWQRGSLIDHVAHDIRETARYSRRRCGRGHAHRGESSGGAQDPGGAEHPGGSRAEDSVHGSPSFEVLTGPHAKPFS